MNDWLLILEAGTGGTPTTPPVTIPPVTPPVTTPSVTTPPATGYQTLTARHSGKCLDVLNKLTTGDATLGQWTCGTGTNQQWQRTNA